MTEFKPGQERCPRCRQPKWQGSACDGCWTEGPFDDRPTCKTCIYLDLVPVLGHICRRRSLPKTWEWPQTQPFQWCGEHPDFPEWLAKQREVNR